MNFYKGLLTDNNNQRCLYIKKSQLFHKDLVGFVYIEFQKYLQFT